jgi:hypothetical protein
MHFTARAFKLAKDPEHPEEFQDAFQMDPAQGIAAMSDGVASAIFSGQWAELLTAGVIAQPPDPDDKDSFARWLRALRQAWSEQIRTAGLAWFQKAKLPQGAFATLLWVRIHEKVSGTILTEDKMVPDTFLARAYAIGDTCLFHVRQGEVLRTFPVEKATQFEADPLVLGSVDLKRDQLLKFSVLDEPCCRDDLLVLCTDAIAEWALRRTESGSAPEWEAFWPMTEQDWRDGIEELRRQGVMRYDDATLVLLRLGPQRVEAKPPHAEEPPVEVEVVEPAAAPAAAATPAPEEDLVGKIKSASDQVTRGIDEVSNRILRGMRLLKGKALEKYRKKFPRDNKRGKRGS